MLLLLRSSSLKNSSAFFSAKDRAKQATSVMPQSFRLERERQTEEDNYIYFHPGGTVTDMHLHCCFSNTCVTPCQSTSVSEADRLNETAVHSLTVDGAHETVFSPETQQTALLSVPDKHLSQRRKSNTIYVFSNSHSACCIHYGVY